MNARGIRTAAYQELRLLSYPRGLPLPWLGAGPPSWGTPPPVLTWPGGTPALDRGTPSWGTPSPILTWSGGYPIPVWGTPSWGTPSSCPGLGPVTGVPHWKGHWTSGSIMGWRWRWVPPPYLVWTDWKHNLPSCITYAVGNKELISLKNKDIIRRFLLISCLRYWERILLRLTPAGSAC